MRYQFMLSLKKNTPQKSHDRWFIEKNGGEKIDEEETTQEETDEPYKDYKKLKTDSRLVA